MILYYQNFRGLTADEIVLDGLRTGKGPNLEIRTTKETGRGVVASERILKGKFVCEYKTSGVYDIKERASEEARHSRNGLGCYIVETQHAVPGFGHLCFDASERFHHPGRYVNHVAKGPNVRLTRPYEVRGKVRIGFLALRDIPKGEEPCYDYGDRSGGEWMRKGKLVEGKVVAGVAETSEKAVDKPMKRKKPHRNSYYCPLPQCYEKPPFEKIANHIHQWHGLQGKEAQRALKQKKLATPAQAREKFQRKRPETESGDIRAMLSATQAPAAGAAGSGSSGKGKGKGKAPRGLTLKGKRKGAEGQKKGKAEGMDSSGEGQSGRPKEASGPRGMGRHEGPFLDGLQAFRMSRAGGKKSERNAKGIAANVSKFLFWCDSSTVEPSFLSKTRSIRAYIEGLSTVLLYTAEGPVGRALQQGAVHMCWQAALPQCTAPWSHHKHDS